MDFSGADGPIDHRNVGEFEDAVDIIADHDETEWAYCWKGKAEDDVSGETGETIWTKPPHVQNGGHWEISKDWILFMWVDKVLKVYEEGDPLAEETQE